MRGWQGAVVRSGQGWCGLAGDCAGGRGRDGALRVGADPGRWGSGDPPLPLCRPRRWSGSFATLLCWAGCRRGICHCQPFPPVSPPWSLGMCCSDPVKRLLSSQWGSGSEGEALGLGLEPCFWMGTWTRALGCEASLSETRRGVGLGSRCCRCSSLSVLLPCVVSSSLAGGDRSRLLPGRSFDWVR